MVKAKKKKQKEEINKLLIENFINLQKVLTELTAKLNFVTEQNSRLLQLFEISTKSFIERQKLSPSPEHLERARELREKEVSEKIDKMLEQNKIIAKGITLMEERIRQNIAKEKEILSDIDTKIEDGFKPRELPHI